MYILAQKINVISLIGGSLSPRMESLFVALSQIYTYI
jgi:hypothetical protein